MIKDIIKEEEQEEQEEARRTRRSKKLNLTKSRIERYSTSNQ